jgi:hypothetical protein
MKTNRAQAVGTEQRQLPRLQIRLAAMAFPGDAPCWILDLTDEGARIAFEEPVPDLDEIVVLELESGRAHEAWVVWRRGTEMGLRLRSAAYMHEPAPPAFAAAEAYWLTLRDRRAPVTTFRLVQDKRQWAVTVQGPSVAEPAVVATFLYRWKAERYAHEQVRALRGKGISAAYAA